MGFVLARERDLYIELPESTMFQEVLRKQYVDLPLGIQPLHFGPLVLRCVVEFVSLVMDMMHVSDLLNEIVELENCVAARRNNS